MAHLLKHFLWTLFIGLFYVPLFYGSLTFFLIVGLFDTTPFGLGNIFLLMWIYFIFSIGGLLAMVMFAPPPRKYIYCSEYISSEANRCSHCSSSLVEF